MRSFLFLSILVLMTSCGVTTTVAGYYQGTYSSDDPAHPYGTIVVNISEVSSEFVNINFTATGFPTTQLNNVSVTSKTENFITTHYFSYLAVNNSLSGSSGMAGQHISLQYYYDVAQYQYVLDIDASK